ncbi:hypothetical protein [Bifidobacterium aerophilum]|uniref:DUF961 domain-containing protein n=1 Tax=Bifidobacterium aerophilum TaxID=1798155 RepID=A0A6N9Z6E4_9BIFI|nr:hypothetical protein [Bifidobacterium aerophilum]NEG90287.1 hypothetical protein [Bifidobacterium aerophilum]
MYQYPMDQQQLGSIELLSVATAEYDGEVMKRDDKPVRVCSALIMPPDGHPEIMEVNIPRSEQFNIPERTKIRFENLTIRGRISKKGSLVYVFDADDMIADGKTDTKPGEPAKDKPIDNGLNKPFGLK